MEYIDLKEKLVNELITLKKEIEQINNSKLSTKLDNILISLEDVELYTIDNYINNGIVELEHLINNKYDLNLFTNNKKLVSVFSSEIKETYFKTELSLAEIFYELELSISYCNNISDLKFGIFGYYDRFNQSNEMVTKIF